MGFLSKLLGFEAATPEPLQPRQAQQPRRQAATASPPRQLTETVAPYFDALSSSQDRTPLPGYLSTLRNAISGLTRAQLARVGEWVYDNGGLPAYAVDTIANYSAPVWPQAASPNPEWNKQADSWFSNWAKRADFTGRFGFQWLEYLSSIDIDKLGDVGIVVTDASGFPQVQLINSLNIAKPDGDNDPLNIDGVVVIKGGVVRGFTVLTDPVKRKSFTFVPASQMILLYNPESYARYRGIWPGRRGANDFRDAKDVAKFEKLATKISAALAAVIQGSPVEEDQWGSDTPNDADDFGGESAPPEDDPSEFEKSISTADLLGGDIPVLPNGQTIQQLDNTRPGERVMELLDYLGGCFVMGVGLPPAFIIDAKLTGPNQRSVNGKAQRKFDNRQAIIAALVEWLYPRLMGWAIDNGELPSQDGFWLLEWQGPPKVSIDDGKDSQQWREDLKGRLMTRQNHFANRALSWMRETDQGFAEDKYIIQRCKDLSAETSIPVEVILESWGYTSPKAAPQSAQNTQPQNTENQNEDPAKTTD